jgi:ribosome-interacting GTPase 1
MVDRFLQRCRIVSCGRPIPEELGTAARVLPVLLILNKCDLDPGGDLAAILHKGMGPDLATHRVSAVHGIGIEDLRHALYEILGVLRVYAKEPGKKADLNRPFVLKRGATVLDLAGLIHKDLVSHFRFARIWGSARFEGQPVERHHPLEDRDIVEIHA